MDKWIKWISMGIWDDRLRISNGQYLEEMSKKEQRPEAAQARSRMGEGARSPRRMQAAPAALLPWTGHCCKMPERAGGRGEGGESRRGWRWGSNTAWRQGAGRQPRGAVPARRLHCVWAEPRGWVVMGWGPDTVREDFGKSQRMQYQQNTVST